MQFPTIVLLALMSASLVIKSDEIDSELLVPDREYIAKECAKHSQPIFEVLKKVYGLKHSPFRLASDIYTKLQKHTDTNPSHHLVCALPQELTEDFATSISMGFLNFATEPELYDKPVHSINRELEKNEHGSARYSSEHMRKKLVELFRSARDNRTSLLFDEHRLQQVFPKEEQQEIVATLLHIKDQPAYRNVRIVYFSAPDRHTALKSYFTTNTIIDSPDRVELARMIYLSHIAGRVKQQSSTIETIDELESIAQKKETLSFYRNVEKHTSKRNLNRKQLYHVGQGIHLQMLNEKEAKKLVDHVTKKPCFINGAQGTHDKRLCFFLEYQRAKERSSSPQTAATRCLLFHGARGTGKTDMARHMAAELNAEFEEHSAPSIVTSYQNSGAESIEKIFSAAQEKAGHGKKVLIFFDEIEALAGEAENETNQTSYKNAMKTLWVKLAEVNQNHPNITVICATNDLDCMNNTFLDRFGANVVEFKNPDETERSTLIQYYFEDYYKVSLDYALFKHIVKETHGFNIRGIVQLAEECEKQQIVFPNTPLTKQTIDEIIKEIRKKFKDPHRAKKVWKNTRWLAQEIQPVTSVVRDLCGIGSVLFGGGGKEDRKGNPTVR